MRKRIHTIIFIVSCIAILIIAGIVSIKADEHRAQEDKPKVTVSTILPPTTVKAVSSEVELLESVEIDYDILEREEVDLIALVTMAEAEGECEEGKRLVIDTILNRVDSEHFPNTVFEVIYQPHQFSSMWNGRVERCYIDDDICKLVLEEVQDRTNYDVIFFNAHKYSNYGVPMFNVENHYFSKYE